MSTNEKTTPQTAEQMIEALKASIAAAKPAASECVWCGEPNPTDTEVCSAKCAEEQSYADRMNEENAKADGDARRIGACPVCGETNKHVCRGQS